jgi:hypothetical protein
MLVDLARMLGGGIEFSYPAELSLLIFNSFEMLGGIVQSAHPRS